MIDQSKINHWFTYHPPQAGQPEIYQTIRNHGREFANVINALVPDGPEKDEALSFVRYAVMAANSGIALGTPDTPVSDHRRATAVKAPAPVAATYQTATTGRKGPSMDDLVASFNAGLRK